MKDLTLKLIALIPFGLLCVLGWGLWAGELASASWSRDDLSYPLAGGALLFLNGALAGLRPRIFRWTLGLEILFLSALWGIPQVFVVVGLLAAYAIFGKFLLVKSLPELGTSVNPLLALSVGTVAFGWLMQGFAYLPLHGSLFHGLVLVAALVLGRRQLQEWGSESAGFLDRWISDSSWQIRLGGSIGISGILYFCYVMRVPEMGNDSLSVHVVLLNQILRDFRFIPDISVVTLAYLPKFMHFVYLPAQAIGGEYALRLLHVAFGILACIGVGAAVFSAGGFVAAGIVTACLVTSPLLLQESASIFVENYLSFLAVVGTWALVTAWQERRLSIRRTILLGALFGAAAGTKLHGLIFAPFFGLLASFKGAAGRQYGAGFKVLVAAVVSYIFVAAPSYLIPWVATGNPVYPYFNGFFGAAGFSTAPYKFPFVNPPIDLELWLKMAIDGDSFLEAGGPVSMFHIYLFAPLVAVGILVWRSPAFVIPAILGLGHLLVVVVAQNYLRYHTPGYFVLSIPIGLALAWAFRGFLAKISLVASTAAILVLNVSYMVRGSYFYRDVAVQELATVEGQRKIRHLRVPERDLVELADTLLEPDERAAIYWHAFSGFSRSYLLAMHPFYSYSAWRDFDEKLTTGELAKFFGAHGVTHVILRREVSFAGSVELRDWLAKNATVVQSNHGASIFKINPDIIFSRTILEPRVVRDWELWGTARIQDQSFVVSGQNLAIKYFEVSTSQGAYSLSLRARCRRGRSLWLHINWYNASGAFLESTMTRHPCGADFEDFRSVFRSPKNASKGAVVLDSPSESEMEVETVSLRGRY